MASSDIARLVMERYLALPKTGKPGLNDGAGGGAYTVVAGIVAEWMSERENGKESGLKGETKMCVVALGTGTKCIGGGVRERSEKGAGEEELTVSPLGVHANACTCMCARMVDIGRIRLNAGVGVSPAARRYPWWIRHTIHLSSALTSKQQSDAPQLCHAAAL